MISKFFTTLFVLVLPFFGKALTRAAAEEVGKYLLDEKSDRDKIIHASQRVHGQHFQHHSGTPNWQRVDPNHTTDRPFHDVLMVAFDVSGPNAEFVHEWLHSRMPQAETIHRVGGVNGDSVYLDSWWVANDERFDGSDTDSAVFVPKGRQAEAQMFLRAQGLV